MGTNYYGRRQIIYPLNFTNINEIEDLQKTQKEIANLLKETHLGKKSSKRNFLAAWNQGNFYVNKKEYLEFAKNLVIYDEYGQTLSFDEFIKIIESKEVSNTVDNKDVFKLDQMDFLDGNWV
jgi:hypothetical protein